MEISVGLVVELEIEVAESDTAVAVGSGDVPVLATPRLLAMAEQATVQAIRDHLPTGQTTVGTEVVLRHRRPSAVRSRITVTGRLAEIDGSRLTFDIAAHQSAHRIADGTVRRVIVDRAVFIDRVRNPTDGGENRHV